MSNKSESSGTAELLSHLNRRDRDPTLCRQ